MEIREQAFRRFAFGESRIMLATDVVSRSFDVPEIRIVVNFDIPFGGNRVDPCFKLFLCRSTRAGRFGRSGLVLTLIETEEVFRAYKRIGGYFGFSVKSIEH